MINAIFIGAASVIRLAKKQTITVYRDQYGKYIVKGNRGKITQKNLTANEIVRYLLNALNEE